MADTTYQQEKNESKTTSEETILELQNIKKYFPIKAGVIKRKVGDVKAVDDVSLALKKGETFGLVGESGCGKSTTGKLIMRLENPTEGKIIFNDKDITSLRGSKLRNMRQDLQMIFQDPVASLNSKMMVGHIVDEPRKNFSKKGH
ncbi:MAG TPA: ATP-binding cassette domain-containing protein, partial [Pseudogracilibacillus sp.]|nr:ATP-binding cassette domain-containing protein [Pseudogracilibacillus sp.]